MKRTINWLALIAGVASLLLIVVSVFVPWWQFSVGDPAFVTMSFSPVNLNFGLLETPLTIPLIWALNIACLLSLAAGGIALLIYAVIPNKPYSKRLLGFGYNKPLFAVILFAIELIAVILIGQTVLGTQIPLMSSGTITLPQSITQDVTVTVGMSSTLLWPVWFAVVVAGLCVATRFYHRKVAPPTVTP
jgi:hypothetical protein